VTAGSPGPRAAARRLAPLAAGLAVGLVAGSLWSVTRSPEPAAPSGPFAVAASRASAGGPSPSGPGGETLIVAWAPTRVDEVQLAALQRSAALSWLTPVRRDEVAVTGVDADGTPLLAVTPGAYVPVDIVAVEADSYAAAVAGAAATHLRSLVVGDALVGASTARRWHAGPGTRVRVLGGATLRVVDIVEDDLIGGAELVVTASTGRALGVSGVRYVLARTADRQSAHRELAAVLGERLRVRAPGETPFLRDADAVPPQATVKEAFGEPPVRPLGPERFEIDPAWVRANIVAEVVPVLGSVRCHRRMVPALRAAMEELERLELAWLVDAGQPHDCFVPRPLGATDLRTWRLSRHAWGIAIDLNAAANLPDAAPSQRPELVEVMERHGFAWGGEWLRPEGAYFEYVGTGRR
jgi:hypothetical protein